MSRSFKHTPRCGDDKSRGWKQLYNRRLRARERTIQEDDESLANGSRSEYKKVNNAYDICDWEQLRYSFEEYWEWVVRHSQACGKPTPSKKEAYREWYKHNVAK